MKLPALQFYPADWRKDPAVQSLTYHDRGVWFEIICLMHESESRGKLLLNGKPMPDDALARALGMDKQTLKRTVSTLIEMGVASRESGVLVNRRMVRDEEIRKKRKECGKLGGNPVLLNHVVNQQVNTPVNFGSNSCTPPSSSTSTSTSSSVKIHSLELLKFGTEDEAIESATLVLGEATMKQWGGYWRNRYRESPGKFERTMTAVGQDVLKGIVNNPGGYAQDTWTRFTDR